MLHEKSFLTGGKFSSFIETCLHSLLKKTKQIIRNVYNIIEMKSSIAILEVMQAISSYDLHTGSY